VTSRSVLLINTGNDPGIGGNANENAYPPLGVISLGTSILNHFHEEIEVHVLDGQVDGVEALTEAISRISPDIVGLSMYSTTIRNTISLLKTAKDCGAVTIVGNDHAAMHHKELFRSVPEIDFICLNDIGEETIVPLVGNILGFSDEDIEKIPLLAFRGSGLEIRYTTRKTTIKPGRSLDQIPIPNRLLLEDRCWDEYARRFHSQARRVPRFSGAEKVTTINRARGCAQMAFPCRYCGIMDLSIRYSSGEFLWKDVEHAKSQIGATVFYEAFDSASSGKQILKSWLKARPAEHEDTHFKMYAQAFESDKDRVELFKELNVFCVNMGLDSGDDNVLKLLKGDRHSLDGNKRAVELYSENDIEIYTSFVLFGLGNYKSTEKSMEATLRFAEWLAAETSTVSFDSALMYPDRLAPIGKLIWNPEEANSAIAASGWDFIHLPRLEEISKKWRNEIFIDPIEIADDFAYVCGVDGDFLRSYSDEIQKLSEKHEMNFGRSQGGALVQ